METETAAAGWYPDPDSADILRYWSGTAWTDARRPIPAPTGDRVGDVSGVLLLGLLFVLVVALIWGASAYWT